MEKITLTGGTLMDPSNKSLGGQDHSHGHHQHVDPLSSASNSGAAVTASTHHHHHHQMKQVTLTPEQQIELSKLVVKKPQHGQKKCCAKHQNYVDNNHGGHGGQQLPRVQKAQWKAVSPNGHIQVPAAALSLMVPLEEILKGTPQEIMEALSTLLRLGQYEKWESLAKVLMDREKKGEHTTTSSGEAPKKTWFLWIDSNGHTLLHWAAKRGDDKRFVEFFLAHAPHAVLKELMHTNSHDNTAMTPLHWACTEPGAQSLGILSLFMNCSVDVNWECTDASGCTPLLIAAQYGQVEVCAYLLQKGRADLYAMDTSLDTALHWAAYKGSLPVCGLLWWYHQQQKEKHGGGHAGDLMAPDQYGQTPLHLAALRGHTSVVRYILHRTAPTRRDKLDLLYHKDTNGRTPLNLALHKNRPTVAAVLQEAQDKLQVFNVRERSQWQIWQRHVTKSVQQMTSVHAWKLWLGLTDFADEMDEAPRFPYYYMWCQGLMHMFVWYPMVFCPLHNPAAGLLWDFPFWHLLNVMNFLICIVTLTKTTYTNPGNLIVEDEEEYKSLPKNHKRIVQYWSKLYETTLESYATTNDMQKAIQQQPLCHTCHIARPLRSKHDRVTRCCVLMFDHHCPFVGNTVGLYNYPYFYMFLASLAFLHVAFIGNLILYLSRSPKIPWGWLLLGIFQGLHVLPTVGMFVYHTQLTLGGLTTNEHMNVAKYDYLMEKTTHNNGTTTKRYRNPWNKGYARNFLDRLSPTAELFTMPQQYRDQYNYNGNNNNSEQEDDIEKQQRQGLLSSSRHDGVV